MKTKSLTRLAALLCGVILLPPVTTPAQKPPTAGIDGTYVLVLDAPAADDTVKKAIDAAVKEFGWPTKGIARGRLEKTNLPPYQKIIIGVGVRVTDVSITTDKRAPIVTPPDGSPVDWPREDNEKVKVSTTLPVDVGPLKQTFKSQDGERVNTYTISADGKTLTMDVVVTSERLKKLRLTYRLVYKRTA